MSVVGVHLIAEATEFSVRCIQPHQSLKDVVGNAGDFFRLRDQRRPLFDLLYILDLAVVFFLSLFFLGPVFLDSGLAFRNNLTLLFLIELREFCVGIELAFLLLRAWQSWDIRLCCLLLGLLFPLQDCEMLNLLRLLLEWL